MKTVKLEGKAEDLIAVLKERFGLSEEQISEMIEERRRVK